MRVWWKNKLGEKFGKSLREANIINHFSYTPGILDHLSIGCCKVVGAFLLGIVLVALFGVTLFENYNRTIEVSFFITLFLENAVINLDRTKMCDFSHN